jgi:predicted RNA-binding Zn-ribbon protein involved in translation (DUF1610 family)
MDSDTMVDGRPGIKMGIKTARDHGFIYLSSIYESYNYRCDLEIREGEIVGFSCPECNKILNSQLNCEYCEAPMVPINLDIGGKVSICSRSGCKGHFLEFEDINTAMKKLILLSDFDGKSPDGIHEDDAGKEIIESGTYLHTYCPKCKKSLIDKGLVKLKIESESKEPGYVFLSPYLNVFTSKSTVFLKEDRVASKIMCPHCEASLVEPEKTCRECGSPAAKIAVSARTKLIDFYLCSKKGCRWHGLDDNDLHDIELEDSLEW